MISTLFGVVDETTTKFTSRACAVHCNSLPVVVDKAVVVVLKFPNVTTSTPAAVKTSLLTFAEFGGAKEDEFVIVLRLFPR